MSEHAPSPAAAERFDRAALAALDEPVVRYLTHALADGAPLSQGMRLRLPGHIRVGAWLSFDSTWDGDGRSFSWEATAGPGPLRFLRVHDQFSDDVGFMDIRLRPGLKLLHAENEDTRRSGAGRAALEALWTPASLLPACGVEWRAESDALIVATFAVGPERPELHIAVDGEGAVGSYWAQRWHTSKDGYLRFGADVQEERRFGAVTIPSRVIAGWWHGTEKWAPFFRCEVTAAEPVP
jgi:hypothetical protein